jgi:hypothetical protein
VKKFPSFKPRNPLINLDSDKRIQVNPRQSNTHERGFSQRNGQGPRKPKRIDRTDGVDALRLGRQGSGQPMLAVHPKPIGVSMLDSLRVSDDVLPVFTGTDPLRSDRRLAMAPRDIQHVGRRR